MGKALLRDVYILFAGLILNQTGGLSGGSIINSPNTPNGLIKSQVFNVASITFLGQFASYSIASIFILFLTLPMARDGLGMTEKQAYEFMGVTQAVGYMMPFIGGYIIDKFLGLRRGITLGVSLLAAAYGLVYLVAPTFTFSAIKPLSRLMH